MVDSSLENQIDCFLEQFKRSASKAMEDRVSIGRSRSSYLDDDSLEEMTPVCEEIEMQNTLNLEPLNVNDIEHLLHPQYAVITGGKSKEGCPIITFPDNNNFLSLNDLEYRQLMLYITSVPSLQEADLGFHLIIDRRKDRWNSVKAVLLKISVYFPGLIHVVYVIRPASFIQKALSEVSNKLFKDEFKFRMIVLSTVEELHEHIDLSQLTLDLGGILNYCHTDWIKQRIELEKFSEVTQQISVSLDDFTKAIEETELPNNVDFTEQLLKQQSTIYSQLKEEILSAAKRGETLLSNIKGNNSTSSENYSQSIDTIGNVFVVERLLVQLEETEKTFDCFWQKHSIKLRHCLELRRFEQDFRELQINFDSHLKTVSEMVETGDNLSRIETLTKEANSFDKLCLVDIERAEEVISSGQHLLTIKNSCPLECVEPKCTELIKMREILLKRLENRMDTLSKSKELFDKIEKANKWCSNGIDLLASQKIEKCSVLSELAGKYILEIETFLKSAEDFVIVSTDNKDFRTVFEDLVTPQNEPLVTQIWQRIGDLVVMCEKRSTSLRKISTKPERSIQTIISSPTVPKQPSVGAPHPTKVVLKKAYSVPKMESTNPHIESNDLHLSPEIDEVNKVKRGHVLTELLETERLYVVELLSIINGYKNECHSEDMQHLIPPGFSEKIDVIFGNLDDIHSFHSKIFLNDLENCISSTDLVALCFVQRRDTFVQLYSYYCQNISRSEHLREALVDSNMFFQTCQRKLGHKLPLAAYLLKPVQRITKYQLLLKDLLRYSDDGKYCKELQQALECMLVVLKCVNDSMHQISITGFPQDLSQQGDLLLQGSFSVWTENKKDIRLRLKPNRRHIFLYQKVMLFCKPLPKTTHNKATYQFKHYLKMSQIGLTESVKGDVRKFEVWLQGRQEVHTIQAANLEQKKSWVDKIKGVLLSQLQELKGEKIKQYSLAHKPVKQTTSWEKEKNIGCNTNNRAMSCDSDTHSNPGVDECIEGGNWSSDGSNSDDEEHHNIQTVPSGHYVALADYCAVGNSEVGMHEGDTVELLKVGCAGWWFVKVIGTSLEGWAPAAYLDNLHRKSSRSSSRSQDRLNDH